MKLFLNGGGCGEQTKETYKYINKIIDHKKKVLYVPLAMDEEIHPYDGCYEWIKEEIKELDIPGIQMVRTFEELSKLNYNEYSMIFIGGGNTFKLLKGIKETESFKKILEYLKNDGIVYGSSAGAMLFCEDINIISIMDPNEIDLKDTKGFNLLDNFSIFVHYKNYKSRLTKEENEERLNKFTKFLIEYSKNKKVVAFPEENTLFVNNNELKMLGESKYYIFDNGKIDEIIPSDDNILN